MTPDALKAWGERCRTADMTGSLEATVTVWIQADREDRCRWIGTEQAAEMAPRPEDTNALDLGP